MRSFLKKVFIFIGFSLAILAGIMAYQLYYLDKLWKLIPEKEPVVARDIDDRSNTRKINIIGCSNLNHDIDIEEVRKAYPNVNIDKYAFAGSLNSCYLKYIVSNIRASGNKEKYLVFAPTNLFFRQNTFPHEPFFYELGISRDFLRFLIKENPMVFLSENWGSVYKSVSVYHFKAYSSIFRNGKGIMDSLANNKTSYSECNFPFDRSKHNILAPNVTPTDAKYFNDIFGKENYAIINSPIPNIPSHLHHDYTTFEKAGFNKPLDRPDSVVRDSSLFYDQWYHMNKCGRTIETAKFIREMAQLHLDK